jgi:hypothetical protein
LSSLSLKFPNTLDVFGLLKTINKERGKKKEERRKKNRANNENQIR